MKINKKFLATAGATLLLFVSAGAAYYHYQRSIKKPYDYSAYYVPSPVVKDPVDEPEEEPDEEQTELSLTLLKETNKDVVGIIEFDERMIYEPVVQAPDNEYYVRRNIDRDYASAGIPFVTGDGNVYSTNVVIYGHSSTRDDIIFTPLMNYTSYDFYIKHPTFRFEMEDVTRVYQIFAVLSVDTKDPYDTLEFAETEWRKETSYSAFLRDMRSRSIYNTGINVSTNDRIMTLVTCDTENGNKRIVVIGKEIDIE